MTSYFAGQPAGVYQTQPHTSCQPTRPPTVPCPTAVFAPRDKAAQAKTQTEATGVQNEPPQHVPFFHVDYLELKAVSTPHRQDTL